MSSQARLRRTLQDQKISDQQSGKSVRVMVNGYHRMNYGQTTADDFTVPLSYTLTGIKAVQLVSASIPLMCNNFSSQESNFSWSTMPNGPFNIFQLPIDRVYYSWTDFVAEVNASTAMIQDALQLSYNATTGKIAISYSTGGHFYIQGIGSRDINYNPNSLIFERLGFTQLGALQSSITEYTGLGTWSPPLLTSSFVVGDSLPQLIRTQGIYVMCDLLGGDTGTTSNLDPWTNTLTYIPIQGGMPGDIETYIAEDHRPIYGVSNTFNQIHISLTDDKLLPLQLSNTSNVQMELLFWLDNFG